MPIQVSYPGVYVEELPSGVRSVQRVPTSVTAFIGRTLRGPVNEPVRITSFSDFQNIFGGLWAESHLGYSVSHFFENGGGEAFIVRLYKAPSDTSVNLKTPITAGEFCFEAANEGSWGNNLRIVIDYNVPEQAAKAFKLDKEKMFNLIVRELLFNKGKKIIKTVEIFENLTIEDDDRRVDRVLDKQSALLRYRADNKIPKDLNAAKKQSVNGVLVDSLSKAENDLDNKLANDPKADVSKEKKALKKILDSVKTSDGDFLDSEEFIGEGKEDNKEGIYALEDIEPYNFNLMCIPPYNNGDVEPEVITKAALYCEKKRAILLVDPPSSWSSAGDAVNGLNTIGTNSKNAALYFPRLVGPDALNKYQPKEFAPSGAIAGIIARTDTAHGIWKAPAGIEAVLQGLEPVIYINDDQNAQLNPYAINCIRNFPVYGNVAWGARTLQGNDRYQSEWKYLPVRRLALFIEESLYRSTQWTVFEHNDEPLWSGLRVLIESFMAGLFRNGAFRGEKASDAYFVKVDSETTTQNDIDQGIVNIMVGFAPTKPAEFIIIRIGQKTLTPSD